MNGLRTPSKFKKMESLEFVFLSVKIVYEFCVAKLIGEKVSLGDIFPLHFAPDSQKVVVRNSNFATSCLAKSKA